jgi:hypothetical protein
MSEKRTQLRRQCFARVRQRKADLVGYIQDISEQGCKILVLSGSSLTVSTSMEFLVSFEEESETFPEPFSFRGEVRWIRKASGFMLCGIHVLSFPLPGDAGLYASLVKYYRALEST